LCLALIAVESLLLANAQLGVTVIVVVARPRSMEPNRMRLSLFAGQHCAGLNRENDSPVQIRYPMCEVFCCVAK
jgi:hypothetical protein